MTRPIRLVVDQCLGELACASRVAEVVDIVNRYLPDGTGTAFFSVAGNEARMATALKRAGFSVVWFGHDQFTARDVHGGVLAVIDNAIHVGANGRA